MQSFIGNKHCKNVFGIVTAENSCYYVFKVNLITNKERKDI